MDSSLGSPSAVGRTLVETTPLALAGLSVALAFRPGLFNIGAAGQLIVGATCAGWVGFTWDLPARSTCRSPCSPGRWAVPPGAHRRHPQGLDRRPRGDHHDHAQLHRVPPARLALRTDVFQRQGRNDPISKPVAESAWLPGSRSATCGSTPGLFLALAAVVVGVVAARALDARLPDAGGGRQPLRLPLRRHEGRRHLRAGHVAGRWPGRPGRDANILGGRAQPRPAATTARSASTPSRWPCWGGPTRSACWRGAAVRGAAGRVHGHAGGHLDAGRHHRRHPGADHRLRRRPAWCGRSTGSGPGAAPSQTFTTSWGRDGGATVTRTPPSPAAAGPAPPSRAPAALRPAVGFGIATIVLGLITLVAFGLGSESGLDATFVFSRGGEAIDSRPHLPRPASRRWASGWCIIALGVLPAQGARRTPTPSSASASRCSSSPCSLWAARDEARSASSACSTARCAGRSRWRWGAGRPPVRAVRRHQHRHRGHAARRRLRGLARGQRGGHAVGRDGSGGIVIGRPAGGALAACRSATGSTRSSAARSSTSSRSA